MKVAQIIDSLKVGGAQKLQVTLAGAARSYDLEICVVSLSEDRDRALPRELQRLGVDVIEFPGTGVINPFRIRALAALLNAKRVDVIQTHLTSANIAGCAAGWIAGIPTVATLHSAGVDRKLVPLHRRFLESAVLRLAASRVIAVGRIVAEANRKRLLGKQIDVIHNAVATFPLLSEEERRKTRESLIGDPQRPLFISAGRLSRPKAYPDLLIAFQVVHRRYPNAVLAIAGDGMLKLELQRQIELLDLAQSVFILGLREDVPRLLAASDVYVSSSHWEGLPVAVLEAMAAGLPVIATAVGDLPEVVSSTIGVLVPPSRPAVLAQEMIGMLEDPIRRRRMGENARAHAIHYYSPDSWISRLYQLYSEVITTPVRLAPETT